MELLKSSQAHKGLTLIEVLVSLAILSIALTAIIKVSSQNIRDFFYLQQKTIATWVGLDVINEAKLQLLKVPFAPDHVDNKTSALGQMWFWQATLKKTPNPHIHAIEVSVSFQDEKVSFLKLKGYLYA